MTSSCEIRLSKQMEGMRWRVSRALGDQTYRCQTYFSIFMYKSGNWYMYMHLLFISGNMRYITWYTKYIHKFLGKEWQRYKSDSNSFIWIRDHFCAPNFMYRSLCTNYQRHLYKLQLYYSWPRNVFCTTTEIYRNVGCWKYLAQCGFLCPSIFALCCCTFYW